ncbi:MAG TPA: hypothetical protein VJB57_00345 [Dehalococcoidia bacterium]|nr:hypothetical protein [Dehalococcoidia bacterium]
MAMTAHMRDSALPGLNLSWQRLGGLLGILGVVLFVIGAVMEGDVPIYTDDAATIRDWFADNGDQFLLADFIIGIGVVFCLVPFFVVLRSVMAKAEGESSLWPQVGLLGAILFVVTGGMASIFTGALAVSAEAISDDGAIVALATMAFYGFNAPGFVLALFFIALGLGIIRSNAFAAPVGWLCLALTVTGILSGLASMDGDPEGAFALLGLVTTLGLGVVVLITGGSLLMRKEE